MINILVALNAEAKPIRQALKLVSVQDSAPWRCYVNEQYRLIVTGTGPLNMAMATSWLFGAYGSASLWLNIGTVGHKSAAPGSIVIANTIKDQKSGQTWLIPILANGVASGTVSTVERTQEQFSSLDYYDMEASGFIQAALRVTERERIHSLKIVSDNENNNASELNEAKLTEVVESAVDGILLAIKKISGFLINDVDGAGRGIASKTGNEEINLASLRKVSSAQEHRWRELSRRWNAVGWSSERLQLAIGSHKSTTGFLDWMETELLNTPVSLDRNQ